ncbi:MAG TPA: hypothetical protein VFV41_04790 [Streptosporangiaceae bacterium]|nr:hypothetical protein [Streptosporangiaceae bacterium]
MGRLRRLRLATALAIAGASAAVLGASAPAALGATAPAGHAAAPRTCTVTSLRAMTALWTVSCTKTTTVTFDVSDAAMNSAYPPRPVSYNDTIQKTVPAGSPYHDAILLPLGWTIYHACTTISANGVVLGSGCFDRSATLAGPCGLSVLGGLNPAWTFGCPGGPSDITVDVSYHYTRPGSPVLRAGHRVFTYSLAQNQTVASGFTPPPNVTITDSVVTVTSSSGHQLLGTASFTR